MRKYEEGKTPYKLDLSSLQVNENSVELSVVNSEVPSANLKLVLTALVGNIFRITVDEVNGLHPRYKPQFALNGEPQVAQ